MQLENTLDGITDLTSRFIEHNSILETKNYALLDSLMQIVPTRDTRITLINSEGQVLYDNFVKNLEGLENHLQRPEIQRAKFSKSNTGSNIRHSASTNQNFFYYAHNYGAYYIRAAEVYDEAIQSFLKADHAFLIFIAFVFVVAFVVLSFVTSKLSESITKLKDFAINLQQNKGVNSNIQFPSNELGVIGDQIVSMYKNLDEAKTALSTEKEKLIKHLFVLREGVGFFSADKKALLTNSHFVQYLNLIAEQASINPEHLFEIKELKSLHKFITKFVDKNTDEINANNLPQMSDTLFKNGYYFDIKCIVFPDKSFEVYINDITKLETRKLLKQQMTSNISHELKTPTTSIFGYLETILSNADLPADKKDYFIQKAYAQTQRLTELLEDISVLNKIEEAVSNFQFEAIAIRQVVDEVLDNNQERIDKINARLKVGIDDAVVVKGDRSLLESIFENLVGNSLNYAGDNITIDITMYHQDEEFYYFSVADNGIGIPEEHLARIFERFYRVDAGRSRKSGGTGLGLAIVKHAVNLHKGEVSVKNAPKGGAAFFFSLPKSVS
ncbi:MULTISPECIES: sensor histidine kinase [unclassified Carboxylicivirga]|uniref:sensor histidine kinase n=1 Tax=Carboxylicivirga TaxID=1628153 RepID=UPI003D350DFA